MLNCTVVTTANDTVLEQSYSGFCSIYLGERMTEPSPSTSSLTKWDPARARTFILVSHVAAGAHLLSQMQWAGAVPKWSSKFFFF